jgi:hypothetical protein
MTWDLDPVTASGITISYDGNWWVESWRRGRLVSCVDCSHWREAWQQAALEVPAYLAWRQHALGAQGRSAHVYVPLPGYEGPTADALLAERDSAGALVLVQVPSGHEPFVDRVRVAAHGLFHGGLEARARVPAARLKQCVCVGVIRDCGHLSVTPQTGPSLRALKAI